MPTFPSDSPDECTDLRKGNHNRRKICNKRSGQVRAGQGRVGLGLVLLDEKGDFLAKAVRVDDPLAARQRALHHQATHQLSLVPHLMD